MANFQLSLQQLDYLLAQCPVENNAAPHTLDSGTFQALYLGGMNNRMMPLDCAPGVVICHEGETGDAMYLIRSGRAAIVKGTFDAPIVLACRGAGEFVGEMALLENLPRSASVVAVDEMRLLKLTREDFLSLLSGSPSIDIGLLRKMSAGLRATGDALTSAARAHGSLSRQVSELEAANQHLMELQRLRDQTTDLIIHDLRNPLHIIIGAVGMLQMVLPEELLQANRELFSLITSNCDRMQRLVDSLLDISRMDAGEIELSLEPANLPQVLQSALRRVTPALQLRGIAASIRVPGQLPSVLIDIDMIDRVVINLLDNAIKFTPSGGQICISAEAHDQHIAVSVTDTGYGIPYEQRDHIFERFARGTDTRTLVRGFGLGLTFCRSAVDAHGGRIWVEDGDQGTGCRFVFTLPVGRET